MALRKILSEKEKENLVESPVLKEDIIRWYVESCKIDHPNPAKVSSVFWTKVTISNKE